MSDERPVVEPELYETKLREIRAGIEDANDEIEAHELVCHRLTECFERYSWVGIYVVEGEKLLLSAWSGPEETEHTEIPVGEGICGLAAKTGETEVVPDVSQRPEFIACFPSTKSEIVVPILGPGGVILGEIDVDSDWLDAFDEQDRKFLEDVAAALAGVMATP